MATRVETKIMEALFKHVSDFIYVPALPVAWPAGGPARKPYQPIAGTPYLKVSFLPATTAGFPVTGGSNHHMGVLQVSVYWPANEGLTLPSEAAGAVIVHFKRDTVLYREGVKVRIRDAPSLGPVLDEPDWVQLPVSIPYQSFTVNP